MIIFHLHRSKSKKKMRNKNRPLQKHCKWFSIKSVGNNFKEKSFSKSQHSSEYQFICEQQKSHLNKKIKNNNNDNNNKMIKHFATHYTVDQTLMANLCTSKMVRRKKYYFIKKTC